MPVCLRERFATTHRGYALSQSLRQLRLRPVASLATLLVLALVLTLPALILFAGSVLDGRVDRQSMRPSVTVYLAPSVSDLEGARQARHLADWSDIERTRYLSRDEALATLRQAGELDDVLGELQDNPLPGSIIVYPVDQPGEPSQARARIAALVDQLEAEPGADRVHYDLVWVERLAAALSLLGVGTALLAAFLLLTALMVIGNTIRLELLRRHAEREVADLLGAGRGFRDRPFLYTGALFGLLGGLMALLLALVAWTLLKAPADELFGLYGRAALPSLPSGRLLALIPGVATLLGLAGALFGLYGPSRVKVRAQA